MNAIVGGINPQSVPFTEKIDQISHSPTIHAATTGQTPGEGYA